MPKSQPPAVSADPKRPATPPKAEPDALDLSGLAKVPAHVAVIMDGNGRWARQRLWDRLRGHESGVDTVRMITTELSRTHVVQQLTLYAFSSENWQRPRREVNALMDLLCRFLRRDSDTMMRNDIRLTCIGRWRELPDRAVQEVERTLALTESNQGMVLCLALNYGARSEILDATRAIAEGVKRGELEPEQIDETVFARHLHQPDMPEPDLLIRTGGEHRVSNFLLWQLSYAEFYVTDVLWPDFNRGHLYDALAAFAQRERRFGGLDSR